MCFCTFGRRGLSRLKGANAHSNEWGRRVESRTRYAIGGMSTVIASVAVVCAVALTNSVALADSVGVPVKATPVVVPSPTDACSVRRGGADRATRRLRRSRRRRPQLPATETVPAPAPDRRDEPGAVGRRLADHRRGGDRRGRGVGHVGAGPRVGELGTAGLRLASMPGCSGSKRSAQPPSTASRTPRRKTWPRNCRAR